MCINVCVHMCIHVCEGQKSSGSFLNFSSASPSDVLSLLLLDKLMYVCNIGGLSAPLIAFCQPFTLLLSPASPSLTPLTPYSAGAAHAHSRLIQTCTDLHIHTYRRARTCTRRHTGKQGPGNVLCPLPSLFLVLAASWAQQSALLSPLQMKTAKISTTTATWWSRHASASTPTTRQPAAPPAPEWPRDTRASRGARDTPALLGSQAGTPL